MNGPHRPPSGPDARNLVIVVRADPIICGHSGEARNLAEAAVDAGFEQIHLVSYPLDVLEASPLPLKPLGRVLPYRPPITVERPEPEGDYKVLDGRLDLAISGRVVDLLRGHRGSTIVMDLYLFPHGRMVLNAMQSLDADRSARVVTVAEAVGSDITNVVATAVDQGRFGAAQVMLTTFLAHDVPVAVSRFTLEQIVAAAQQVDDAIGADLADEVAARTRVSYPAIDTDRYLDATADATAVDDVLARRGLARDGFVLFLSRITPAKGVDDLIDAYRTSSLHGRVPLVVAGTGPGRAAAVARAAGDPAIRFLDDVDDDEKIALMHGCRAFALPTKPMPEFTETFGIALAEKMLAGGTGVVVTTPTGGVREATGGHAFEHDAGDVDGLRACLERVDAMPADRRALLAAKARAHALRFDRDVVLRTLLDQVRTVRAFPDAPALP